jgi:hypothetical protein
LNSPLSFGYAYTSRMIQRVREQQMCHAEVEFTFRLHVH